MSAADRERAEQGFATVWSAIAIAALLVVTAAMFWLGAAVLARHRATWAADLAALAAAGRADLGVTEACARATAISDRMGARIRDCTLREWDALIRVEVDLPGPLAGLGPATGRARAGPVDRPP
ncbi:helicase [Amycolatopsis antarctica]|uniref:Helicase n=1 Tax=Amycolatopsis antarctica TaxID=1854586 RepID=A0A263D7M7_9PSEU|nr:Rv3654c family TadE-like protein [Amycolatopsis antarctica]OZM73405.1 helicase [Amycolatopsis antarctica]